MQLLAKEHLYKLLVPAAKPGKRKSPAEETGNGNEEEDAKPKGTPKQKAKAQPKKGRGKKADE